MSRHACIHNDLSDAFTRNSSTSPIIVAMIADARRESLAG